MIRRHAALLAAIALTATVITACVVRTRPHAQPVYVESHEKHKKAKHKKAKHKKAKHKKHHDGHGDD